MTAGRDLCLNQHVGGASAEALVLSSGSQRVLAREMAAQQGLPGLLDRRY